MYMLTSIHIKLNIAKQNILVNLCTKPNLSF